MLSDLVLCYCNLCPSATHRADLSKPPSSFAFHLLHLAGLDVKHVPSHGDLQLLTDERMRLEPFEVLAQVVFDADQIRQRPLGG